jgi:hypothetical protein
MKRTTRIVSALLAGLLLSTTMLACGNTKGDEQTTTTAPATDSNEITTSATAETTIDPMIANDPKLTADDWGGEEFVILYNGSQVEPNKDFTAETLNGNVLNDAIYNRNMAIQDKYNLKINASYYSDGNISTMVGNSNKAGDNAYHLVEANGAYSMSMALNGQLYNLEALEYVNLDKPYWNSMILEGSSIEGKNYFAYSDANIHAYGATPCVLFNKEMLATFQLGDIYQIVTDGKWTFDVMSTMIQTVTGDINGDGVITKDDRLGYIANNFCVDCFISGTGYRMITKDADDLPVLNVETEKFYNIIDGIKKLCAEENGVFLIDRTSTATEAREYWTEEAFVADRALFVGGNLKWAERLRAMENDFGIVPLPKYDENQENYAVHFQANVGASMAVPSGNTDVVKISKVLEDIAYDSYLHVMPAYTEIVLEGQSVRDEESIVSLNIIRNSYYSDLGFMLGNYNIAILTQMRQVVTNNQDCASILKQVMRVYTNALKKVQSPE